MSGSSEITTPAACLPAWRASPSSFLAICQSSATSGRPLTASARGGLCRRASSSVMLSVSGTSFAILSTSPNGMPSTRPTSRMTAFALSTLKVMICATRSRPYRWTT